MRRLKSWPLFLLQAMITFRKKNAAWLDAYEELQFRAQDVAEDYAKSRNNAWVVIPPRGFQ